MTRLQTIQLKGENCKHRWAAKGDSSKYTNTHNDILYLLLHYTTPPPSFCVPQDNLVLADIGTISVRWPPIVNWPCRCWGIVHVGTD